MLADNQAEVISKLPVRRSSSIQQTAVSPSQAVVTTPDTTQAITTTPSERIERVRIDQAGNLATVPRQGRGGRQRLLALPAFRSS